MNITGSLQRVYHKSSITTIPFQNILQAYMIPLSFSPHSGISNKIFSGIDFLSRYRLCNGGPSCSDISCSGKARALVLPRSYTVRFPSTSSFFSLWLFLFLASAMASFPYPSFYSFVNTALYCFSPEKLFRKPTNNRRLSIKN